MDSNLHHQHNPKMSSGLTRYQSAPSSYFESFVSNDSGGDFDPFLNGRSLSPETYRICRRFMSSGGPDGDSNSHNLCGDIGQNSYANEEALQSQFAASLKHESMAFPPNPPPLHQQQQQQNSEYSSASQLTYQGQKQPSHSSAESNLGVDNSYRLASSMAMDRSPQMMMGGGNSSCLIRHNSSPAGLFSHIDGYGVMRSMGNFGAGNNTNAEASFSSASRLKGKMEFPTVPHSSSGLMSTISEVGRKSEDDQENEGGYLRGFPVASWDDSAMLSDNFLKGERDNHRSVFSSANASENQSGGGNRPPAVLSHHLSLPTSSAELCAMEKILELQDSVPCKLRAKRGYATHPRSIAERVRRTRISERMRKLQELVPNMDKQTSTADMLDLAVEYIKDLEKQVKMLSDMREKCTCSNKQKP